MVNGMHDAAAAVACTGIKIDAFYNPGAWVGVRAGHCSLRAAHKGRVTV